MKDLIVNSLETICKIAFGLLMLVGLLGFFGSLVKGSFVGALVSLIIAFVIGVVMFGGIFLLLDMNSNLRAIRTALDTKKE